MTRTLTALHAALSSLSVPPTAAQTAALIGAAADLRREAGPDVLGWAAFVEEARRAHEEAYSWADGDCTQQDLTFMGGGPARLTVTADRRPSDPLLASFDFTRPDPQDWEISAYGLYVAAAYTRALERERA